MANSTVYAIKADITDFETQIKNLEEMSGAVYASMAKDTKELSKQYEQYENQIKANDKTLNKFIDRKKELLSAQIKNGKLTKEESAELARVNKQISAQKKLNTELENSELKKYKNIKRNISAYKSELSAIKQQKSYYAEKIANTKKLIGENKKLSTSSKSLSSSLRKEDAVRRSLSTSEIRHIRQLESLAVAYYSVKTAWGETFGQGIELQRQYESMSLGLSALVASKMDDITTTGRQVDSAEKLQIAQKMTTKTMDELKTASYDTVATFDQMVGFYQQGIGHALSANDALGVSFNEISHNMIDIAKRMSNLGGAVGMPMDMINEEIRSLMSGDVSRDSKLALILFGSPTAANAAIKEAKKQTNGLTNLLNQALEPFANLEKIMTFDKAVANMKGQWQTLQKEMSKPIFDDTKAEILELTEYLKIHSKEIVDGVTDTYEKSMVLFKVLGAEAVRGITPVSDTLNIISDGLDGVNDKTSTSIAMFSVFADLAHNTGVVLENAFIELGQITSYVSMNSNERQKFLSTTNEIIDKNRKSIIEYDKLGDHGAKAAKKISDSFAAIEEIKHPFSKITIKSDTPFADLEKAYESLTKKYAGNKEALNRINELYEKAQNRLYDNEMIKSEQLKVKRVKDAAEADKKILTLRKKLQLEIAGQNPYDALIEKAKQFDEKAKGDKETLLLVDKWYYSELAKLNDKELEKYRKNIDEKHKLEAGLIEAGLKFAKKRQEKKLKEDAEYIKTSKEFESESFEAGWDSLKNSKKAEATFQKWGDTLNSSISNSIVDAIQSGDVEGALKGLGSSIGSSMIQASTSNIVAGGSTLQAAGGLMSMGGLYGIAAGVGISVVENLISGLNKNSHSKSAAELLKEYQGKYNQQAKDYEHNVKPITDRLDRQIELLQAISGYGGSAVSNELKRAQETYKRQSVVDTLKALGLMGTSSTFKAHGGNWYNHWDAKLTLSGDSTGTASATNALFKKYSDYVNATYYEKLSKHDWASKTKHSDYRYGDAYGKLNINESTKTNASKYIEFLMKLKDNKDLSAFGVTNQEYKDIINQAEKTTHDFAMSVINSYQTIFDAGKSFKDDYDKLFGNYYKNKALAQAQADVNKLRGGQSLQSYLKDVITTIDSMKLTKAQIDLLQSENEKDLPAKIKLEKELSQQYGKNVEAALNYKDSIDLVAQSMGDNVKALNDAWLGNYSPLTMLQKTAYANSIANNVIPSTMSASEKALLALQQSQATATTDEQARAAFNRYVATLDAQVEDSTRTDIVNAIQTSNEKLDEVVDRLERIGA